MFPEYQDLYEVVGTDGNYDLTILSPALESGGYYTCEVYPEASETGDLIVLSEFSNATTCIVELAILLATIMCSAVCRLTIQVCWHLQLYHTFATILHGLKRSANYVTTR